jgi:Leucine-rich repeat (LRR) protein
MPNLTIMDVRSNKICEISSSIKHLKNLRVIMMDKNLVKRLPVEIYDLISLETL